MNSTKLFRQVIGFTLVVLLLVGCSGARVEPTTMPTSTPTDTLMITEPISMELALVRAGEFLMGSDPAVDTFASKDDQPQHTVELPEFYIGKYEVTNTQYAAFVEATGHRSPMHWRNDTIPRGKENHPVVWVS